MYSCIFNYLASCYSILLLIIYFFYMILIAHIILVIFYRAKTTLPKAPFPNSFTIVKSDIEALLCGGIT